MTRSRLRIIANKTKNLLNIKKQKYTVNLLMLNLIPFNNKNAIFEYFNRYSTKNSNPLQVSDKLIFPISIAGLILVLG